MAKTIQLGTDAGFAAIDDIHFPAETETVRAQTLRDAVAYRKAGGRFYTANEFMEQVRTAIDGADAARGFDRLTTSPCPPADAGIVGLPAFGVVLTRKRPLLSYQRDGTLTICQAS